MALTTFEIVSIPVADPQKAKAWYMDIMGFELVREEPMGPEMSWIQLAPKGSAVTIALVTWFENMKPGGITGLMINSDDLDADRTAIAAKGVAIGAIEQQPWGRYAQLTDMDGNGWIIRQALPE